MCNFTYCSLSWHFCGKQNAKKLERILKRALRMVFRDYSSTYDELLECAGITTLSEGRLRTFACELFKSLHGKSPSFMWDHLQPKNCNYDLRSTGHLRIPKKRTTKNGLNSFSYLGPKIWNTIPEEIKSSKTVANFKYLMRSVKLSGTSQILV